MRVLGIDPGSRITGLGVVEIVNGKLVGVASQALKLGGGALSGRLGHIYHAVGDLIVQTQPDVVAIEQVFMAKNAQSALKLGQARGAAIVASVSAELPVSEYTALQVKSAVVGYGKASKSQVQQMVKALMKLPEIAQEDASDALAVAICHANSHHLTNRLQKAISTQTQQRKRTQK